MKLKNMANNFPNVALLAAVIITLQCFHTSILAVDHQGKEVYIVYMGEKKHPDPEVVEASHYDLLASILGSKESALASIIYSYKHGFSGFSAWLTETQAQELAELPDVISVKRNQISYPQTTRSWDFLDLDYNNPSGLLKKTNYGDGIIIGVIDTGVWPESASFNDKGYGPVPSRWNGTCQVGQNFTTSNCNRKIIGARYYKEPSFPDSAYQGEYLSPRDANGHGTHTASTAGGNIVNDVSFFGLASGAARGGAPNARLAIYKVCWGSTGCGDAAMLKAMDDAISDGVDVLSISIGGPFSDNPGTLHAVAKGIVVVFSGGNDGPTPQTVTNPSPWVITVAAATIDRSFPTTITLGDNTRVVGQSLLYGAGVDFAPLYFAGLCNEDSLNGINITGTIIFCYEPGQQIDLGIVMNSVVNGTGAGLIYADYTRNSFSDLQFNALAHLPTVMVDFVTAEVIRKYYGSNNIRTVKLSLTRTVVGSKVPAPKVASFSSRGPSYLYPGVLKPDIAAPGTDILAAAPQIGNLKKFGVLYQFKSGTSMACPHISGIVALLKSLHPQWSPAAIKSALITTASVVDGYGLPILSETTTTKVADPFDYGGGHVNPEKAVDPGLVYDINPYEYLKFFYCSNGLGENDACSAETTDFYGLNLPSISIHDLKTSIIVSRTVTNVGPVKSVYKASFEAPPGVNMMLNPDTLEFDESAKTHTFKITFTAIHSIQGDFTFGSLTWSDNCAHTVRIPIATYWRCPMLGRTGEVYNRARCYSCNDWRCHDYPINKTRSKSKGTHKHFYKYDVSVNHLLVSHRIVGSGPGDKWVRFDSGSVKSILDQLNGSYCEYVMDSYDDDCDMNWADDEVGEEIIGSIRGLELEGEKVEAGEDEMEFYFVELVRELLDEEDDWCL